MNFYYIYIYNIIEQMALPNYSIGHHFVANYPLHALIDILEKQYTYITENSEKFELHMRNTFLKFFPENIFIVDLLTKTCTAKICDNIREKYGKTKAQKLAFYGLDTGIDFNFCKSTMTSVISTYNKTTENPIDTQIVRECIKEMHLHSEP